MIEIIKRRDYFYLSGIASIILGFIGLVFLNASLLTSSMFNIAFPLPLLAICLGIMAIFKKQSRVYGIYGISISIFLFLFVVILSVLSLTINYHP